MLGRLAIWRHAIVVLAALAAAVIGWRGIAGHPRATERVQSLQVTVTPAGGDAVRIREVIDEDFGYVQRHGAKRIIPDDYGVPSDIRATSPDAPAELYTSTPSYLNETTIRIGNPDKTVTGQHRYVLEYTLPRAHLTSGKLFLDIVAPYSELDVAHVEVVVDGWVLTSPTCSYGYTGTDGGCELVADGGRYRVVIDDVGNGKGLTVGGTIATTSGPTDVPVPPVPSRRSDDAALAGLAMGGGGLVAGLGVFLWFRRRGRNEVASGGAADAAFATAPGSPAVPASVDLVADDRMGALATTEFAPPAGLQPWQGAALLTEHVGTDTTAAWVGSIVARDALRLEQRGVHELHLLVGPNEGELDPEDAAIVKQLMNGRVEVRLGKYDASIAAGWKAATGRIRSSLKQSGWWIRTPGAVSGAGGAGLGTALAVVLLIVLAFIALAGKESWSILPTWWAAALAATAVVGLVAAGTYAVLLARRSAAGSALALRTESFRRFLEASEGQHVDWAWQHGLLREYTAWAVALGAAKAWGRAVEASNVPPQQMTMTGPWLVSSMGSTIRASTVQPSQSRGGSSGGFSGFSGSVGGGGGGGSFGSW